MKNPLKKTRNDNMMTMAPRTEKKRKQICIFCYLPSIPLSKPKYRWHSSLANKQKAQLSEKQVKKTSTKKFCIRRLNTGLYQAVC